MNIHIYLLIHHLLAAIEFHNWQPHRRELRDDSTRAVNEALNMKKKKLRL